MSLFISLVSNYGIYSHLHFQSTFKLQLICWYLAKLVFIYSQTHIPQIPSRLSIHVITSHFGLQLRCCWSLALCSINYPLICLSSHLRLLINFATSTLGGEHALCSVKCAKQNLGYLTTSIAVSLGLSFCLSVCLFVCLFVIPRCALYKHLFGESQLRIRSQVPTPCKCSTSLWNIYYMVGCQL